MSTSPLDRAALLAELAPVPVRLHPEGMEATDICSYPLGSPLAWLSPRTTQEVQHIVAVARKYHVSIVPVGRLTASWRPLHLEGALALDMSALSFINPVSRDAQSVHVGAGTDLRDIFEQVKRQGYHLMVTPDSFGDTSPGAMAATDFASGIGMARCSIRSEILSLTVVTGTGEIIKTGTAATLGVAPFMRSGLPDVTELFVGSNGCLGIITELHLRVWPQVTQRAFSWNLPYTREHLFGIFEIARRLRYRELYETFRCEYQNGFQSSGCFECVLVLSSNLPGATLEEQTSFFLKQFAAVFPGQAPTELPAPKSPLARVPDWLGAKGDHAQMRNFIMTSIDINASYEEAAKTFDLMLATNQRLAAQGSLVVRNGIYFGVDHVNIGQHSIFPQQDGSREHVDRLIAEEMKTYSGLAMIPYRWGRLWGPFLQEKVSPVYREALLACKRHFDPDQILHPGGLPGILAGE